MTSAEEIRRVVDNHAAAVRRGDVEAMLADYADDVLVFDVVVPLRRSGREAAAGRAREWLTAYETPVAWDNQDVTAVADGEVGYCTMLSHVAGTLRGGAQVDMWFRKTLGLTRRGGRWLITHDHGSVPFEPETQRAALVLQP